MTDLLITLKLIWTRKVNLQFENLQFYREEN